MCSFGFSGHWGGWVWGPCVRACVVSSFVQLSSKDCFLSSLFKLISPSWGKQNGLTVLEWNHL